MQCRPEPDDQQRTSLAYDDITEDLSSLPSSSSSASSESSSLDLDINIRQMEETQRRINLTLENLLKLRQQQQKPARNCPPVISSLPEPERKRHSLDNRKTPGNRNSDLDSSGWWAGPGRDLRNNNRNSYQHNHQHQHQPQHPLDSPMKNRIQGLINSVKNLKNRNSVGQEEEKSVVVSRQVNSGRTKESFSVEDFTELMSSLPANHFPQELPGSSQAELSESRKSRKNQNQVFHIVKELMSSEADFIASLTLICDDFTNFLHQASQQVSVPNLDNLPEILELSRNLLQEFQYRFHHWEEIRKISDVFLSHSEQFGVYLRYLRNFSNMNKHFDDCYSNNPQFRSLSESFEALPVCRSLKLKHYLLKPVQRLPQYKLLLADYLKHLENEGEDYQDSLRALHMITDLLKNANDVIL